MLQTQILTTLISNIKTLLQTVTEIKEVKAHGYSRLTKYPAVVFIPESFENSYQSTEENFETHKFKIWVIVGVSETTLDNAFETVLPKAVDAIKEKINDSWDGGTIDGHRVWYTLDSGNFGLSEEDKGLQAWAELSLTIKLTTNN